MHPVLERTFNARRLHRIVQRKFHGRCVWKTGLLSLLFANLLVLILKYKPTQNATVSSTNYADWKKSTLWADFDAQKDVHQTSSGEAEKMVFKTRWILKVLNLASKSLRNYRQRHLRKLERGQAESADNDPFASLAPILAAIGDQKAGKPLDIIALLPQILQVYGQFKSSDLFKSDDFVKGFLRRTEKPVLVENFEQFDKQAQ